jgi:hypothetical protein
MKITWPLNIGIQIVDIFQRSIFDLETFRSLDYMRLQVEATQSGPLRRASLSPDWPRKATGYSLGNIVF